MHFAIIISETSAAAAVVAAHEYPCTELKIFLFLPKLIIVIKKSSKSTMLSKEIKQKKKEKTVIKA